MQGLSFLVVLAVAIGCMHKYVLGTSGVHFDGLRVKYNETDENGFIRIPRTIAAAENEGYIKTERPPGHLSELIAYCPIGRTVCPLFHPNGFIAGMQLSFLVNEITFSSPHLIERFVKWNVTENNETKQYYSTSQYYMSEEQLASGDGPTEANGSTLQYDGVWVEDIDGVFKRFPLTEDELISSSYTKETCVTKMGTHYLHNMTEGKDCSELHNWYSVLSNGKINGVSFHIYANLDLPSTGINYFERYNDRQVIEDVFPVAPKCFYELSDISTLLSIHMYYVDDPMSITCRPEDSVQV